jgi:hypothetical protein
MTIELIRYSQRPELPTRARSCSLGHAGIAIGRAEGLGPLEIDRGWDLGSYWEPNVWIVHAIQDNS